MNSYLGRILLVDDDEKVRNFYTATFTRAGYTTIAVSDLASMREALSKYSFDAVFLDLKLGRENGIDGLPYVLKTAPFTMVFILSSQNSIDKAIECIDRGANWYFTKGTEPDDILTKLASYLEGKSEVGEKSSVEPWRENLVGTSKAINETAETILKLRDVDSTVLILGESGTGKEVVARALHKASTRANARFEAINCGAIPENLLESELFGHKKGSFTDAKADRKGIFEICDKGTLLLDEIGDMPLALQTKLLRVLQEKQVQPVGASTAVKIETRVIAATHRDILDEVKSGRFREDLYYRLSVVMVQIPALRHRKEDIPLLVDHFLSKFNKRFKKTINRPSQSTMSRLMNYDWPGNIRELQNAIERGIVLSGDGNLSVDDMFSHLKFGEAAVPTKVVSEEGFLDHPFFDLPLTDAKQAFEKTYIERLLKLNRGNVAELARRSGRYRADLYRVIERYGIDVDSYRQES